MVIGVTEGGDAGIDLSWINKAEKVNGLLLITKEITAEFCDAVLACPKPAIVHVTCTGFGGTILEPNVPDYREQLNKMEMLLHKGFPRERLVVRIDPMIPTEKGLQRAQAVVERACGIVNRFRVSVLDMYPHVRKRFSEHGLPLPYGERFSANAEQFRMVDNWLESQKEKGLFEACAEPKLTNVVQRGCLSDYDINLMGLTLDREYGVGFQRRECKCLGCKRELLPIKKPCQHGCLYCFGKMTKNSPCLQEAY